MKKSLENLVSINMRGKLFIGVVKDISQGK